MKDIITLEDAITAVHNKSALFYDEVVSVGNMSFESLDQMVIDGQQVEVLLPAQKLLCNRLRVPYSYLSRCPEELQNYNLNHWIEQERKTRDTFFCRFDGNKLRAVFTDRYQIMDNMGVLAQMLAMGFSPGAEVQYTLTDEMMLLKLPEYDQAFNVATTGRDEIIPGICVSNSEVGVLAFSIEAFFYRLVCSNGMLAEVSAGNAKFKHISTRALDLLPQTIAGVVDGSRRYQDQFAISTKTYVEDPAATFRSFNRRFLINKKEAGYVEEAFTVEPGDKMFHIVNSYTRAAQSPSLTPEASLKLEKTGGQILGLVKP